MQEKNKTAKPTYTTALLSHIGRTKKNKKRILFYLGSLTPLQAQQILNTLKITRSPDTFTATFNDLIFEDHWRYLDISFLNHLWNEEWKGLSENFPSPKETNSTRKKEISTAEIAKILTFYRS